MNKLSSSQIFRKTLKYVVLRMMIPLVSAIVSVVAMKVITGITAGEEGKPMGWIGILIWLVITGGVYFLLDFMIGYKFHAGHMAIITDAVSVSMIPDNMSALAKECTEDRFPSGNEYLSYKNAVRGSLQQLQYELNTFAENKMRVPVLGQLIRFCQFIIGHELSFTYDLVLCYTFWRDGKTLYTSAADGVAIYWDSWKRMMNNIWFLVIEMAVGMTVGFLFVFVLAAASLSPASGIGAGALAGIATGYFVCKAAKVIIDTNLTLKTLDAYFEEGQYADYNSEQYEDMCKYSKTYSKLYHKALDEAFAPATEENYGYDYNNYSEDDYDYSADFGNWGAEWQ